MGAAVTAEPKAKKSKVEVSPEHAEPAASAFDLEAGHGAPAGMPLFLALGLQRKLAVGAVDDPLEREADQVAEQVMRSVDGNPGFIAPPFRRSDMEYPGIQRKCACGGSASGQCDECRKNGEEELPGTPVIHRRASGNGGNGNGNGNGTRHSGGNGNGTSKNNGHSAHSTEAPPSFTRPSAPPAIRSTLPFVP